MPNAFIRGKQIEARSLAVLEPWLRERADNGEFVLTDKGVLCPLLQEIVGDILMRRDGRLIGVEHKAELRWTGNLFLETWSNRNLRDRDSYAKYGSNRGWLEKTRADLLIYHFIDADKLIILDMFRLQQWAFGIEPPDCGHLMSYREIEQKKNVQKNETRGCPVPVADLRRIMPMRETTVRQLAMSFVEAAE